MKFAILLLVCCCAVALARPDGSKEVSPSPVKVGSKEVKHSGEHSKGSGESKESSQESGNKSSEESGNKSSHESGKKDGGGAVTGIPLPHPSMKQVELVLDHVVEIVASIFRLHNVHSVRDLVTLIESYPIGNIIWTTVIHPFLKNIEQYRQAIITIILEIQSRVLQFFPVIHLFAPLELPQAIIQFVFSILSNIAKIFRQY